MRASVFVHLRGRDKLCSWREFSRPRSESRSSSAGSCLRCSPSSGPATGWESPMAPRTWQSCNKRNWPLEEALRSSGKCHPRSHFEYVHLTLSGLNARGGWAAKPGRALPPLEETVDVLAGHILLKISLLGIMPKQDTGVKSSMGLVMRVMRSSQVAIREAVSRLTTPVRVDTPILTITRRTNAFTVLGLMDRRSAISLVVRP